MKTWDRRKKSAPGLASRNTPLPIDYLKLVEETLTQALAKGLHEMKKHHPVSEFHADGALYGDEALLAVTLSHGANNIAATTVYASADYVPGAEKPGLEATLSACLDAIGGVFDFYLDPEHLDRIAQLADRSLGALEEAPFDWTQTGSVWVKLDKSNPKLEHAAEDWLRQNDPNYKSEAQSSTLKDHSEAEEFLEDRLEAIKKAKSGQGGGPGDQSGPIRH